MRRHVVVCTCFTILAALGGCGGGGDRAEEPSEVKTNATAADVRVMGVVGPGLVRDGDIIAYKLDASGQRGTEPLATSKTDANGYYELVLDAVHAGEILEIEVSSAVTGSTMVCGAARCGDVGRLEGLPLPDGFELNATVAVPRKGGAVEASITPWSALVAARAKALQRLSVDMSAHEAHLQASAEVGQIVGVDVVGARLAVPTTLESADAGPAHYAVVSDAVGDMLLQSNDVSALSGAMQQFVLALSDGVFGNPGDGFSPRDLSAAIRRVVDSAPELSSATVESLANLSARFDLLGEEGFKPGYDPVLALAADATRAEKISAFQTFTSQVRTWLSSLGELEADELTHVFAIDTQTVRLLMDDEVQTQFQFVADLVNQMLTFVTHNPLLVQEGLANGEAYPMEVLNHAGRPIGQVSLRFADDDGLRLGAVGIMTGESNSVYRPVELTLHTEFPVGDLLAVFQDQQMDSRAFAQLLTKHQIVLTGLLGDGQGNPSLELHKLAVAHQLAPGVVARESGGVSPTRLFKSAYLGGEVTVRHAGAVFSGSAEQWVVRLGAGVSSTGRALEQPLFSERWRLSGEFVSPDKTKRFSASATARAKSSSAFDTFSWLEYGNDKRYMSGSFRNTNQFLSIAESHTEDVLLPAVSVSADFSEATPMGVVEVTGYSVASSSRDVYRECLDDVVQMHENQFFLLDSLPRNAMCAAAHLEPVHRELPLTNVLLNQLKSSIQQDVTARYGLDTTTAHSLTIGEVHGYINLDGGVNAYTADIIFANSAVTKNFNDVSFTVAAVARLPDMRTAQLAISARGGDGGDGHLRADVAWENGSYTAVFDIDDLESPTSLNARLLNTQGYELAMQVSRSSDDVFQLSGSASIDGEEVGYLELRDNNLPLIVYPNGDENIIETVY